MIRRSIGATVALLIACAPEAPPPPSPPPPPVAWGFDAPVTWDDRVSLSEAMMPGEQLSARVFLYAPRDTAIRPQALLGIVVYDSAAWRRVVAAGGPPPGDSLASVRGQVFVASLPQSNPFVPASADARAFDSLAVDLPGVRQRFRVMP